MRYTALVILNYNNPEDTANCIDSIFMHNTAPVKFMVIDNASRPEYVEHLKKVMHERFGADLETVAEDRAGVLKKASLLLLPENVGYARGNNAGLEIVYRDPEIDRVMILNNDILFVEDIVPGLIERMEKLSDCSIISPVLYKKGLKELDYNCARRNVRIRALVKNNLLHYVYRAGRKKSSYNRYILKETEQLPDLIEIELPSGSCMLTDKEYFRQIGSFDSGTFLYYEENILHRKIMKTGRKNYLCTGLKCIHLGASSTSKKPGIWTIRHAVKSEKYYVRHHSGAGRMARSVHSLSCAFYLATVRVQKALSSLFRK